MCNLLFCFLCLSYSSCPVISAKLLGFKDYIPPCASVNGDELLTGCNFASAAAGIRDETGQQLVVYNEL